MLCGELPERSRGAEPLNGRALWSSLLWLSGDPGLLLNRMNIPQKLMLPAYHSVNTDLLVTNAEHYTVAEIWTEEHKLGTKANADVRGIIHRHLKSKSPTFPDAASRNIRFS